MRNYWSCSRFADFLRGIPKLEVGSSKEWNDWEKEAKTKHPIRYYIAEEFLDKIQDIIMYPIDKLYAVKYWFNNRFITKTHALTSNLKKGEWHELDERILHCLFTELVKFVQIEKSWKNIICDEDAARKYNAPWFAKGWGRFRTWRNEESGLDHLDWETTLVKDESWGLSPDDLEFGKPTHQALAAQEISELYHWWVYERPKRVDPFDASGWTEYCEEKRKKTGKLFWEDFDEETVEEREISRKMLELHNKIEEEYYQEDESMLIRLIKLRRSLWT